MSPVVDQFLQKLIIGLKQVPVATHGLVEREPLVLPPMQQCALDGHCRCAVLRWTSLRLRSQRKLCASGRNQYLTGASGLLMMGTSACCPAAHLLLRQLKDWAAFGIGMDVQ